ncbi:hypothetical protein G210_0537 [Candida maltosa Xu316]|uniref:Kinesin-like protein n=1 Tax=Candida maltosa (strain Xu316) TaxID=1245528 RepID=M3IQQ6_CANMX|nr:hypothetical protein G210_0537 [Candida maltosa Xu316]
MSNIQVIVRCRGRNSQEVTAKSPVVVELSDDNFSITDPFVTVNQISKTRTSTTSSSLDDSQKKTYTFDQIYGSQADQSLVYSQIAHPLLLDFLHGINVSILAYGQTGTGKTYTMSGLDANNTLDETSEMAGIIPRLLRELFEKLSSSSNDFMVKISYLEIYNEELIDLLNNGNGNSRKLRIHEKNAGKSKAISVHNLTEYCINDYQQGIKYLKMGLQKKKTSTTNMNDNSSRSHTIFSLQLFRKISPDDESLYRISKMNLVDLAGSENISRSGSIVKEAGGINQSLLTLGRVINSLNETKSQHIPYRESKLTYILQDSLGGNTKTTLIATISPAQVNFMETCSTLDYASKAKNIKNTPRIGLDSEVIMKKTLVKTLAQELTQINMDLIATRTKNGIYLDPENYDQIIQEHESLKTQAKEDRLRIESLNAKVGTLEFTKQENKQEIDKLKREVEEYKAKLNIMDNKYREAVNLNQTNEQTITDLNEKLKRAFKKSSDSAKMLMNLLSTHLSASVDIIKKSQTLQSTNKFADELSTFEGELTRRLSEYQKSLQIKVEQYQQDVENVVNRDLTSYIGVFQDNFDKLLSFQNEYSNSTNEIIHDLRIVNEKLSGFLKDDYLNGLGSKLDSQLENIIDTNFSELFENLKKSMTKELSERKNNVVKEYQNMSNQEISKERKNLLKMETSWHDQISTMIPKLESGLNGIDGKHQHAKSEVVKISNTDLFTNINQLSQNKISIPEHPDVSKISKISTDIKELNHRVADNLEQIENELSEIQRFDTEMVKISPIKESGQPTKFVISPTKATKNRRHSGLNGTPSKIPVLQRSKTDEDPSNVKRRKILHTVDNVLL